MKTITSIILILFALNSFAAYYEVHELKTLKPLKSEDLRFLVYKQMKKELKDYMGYNGLKLEEVTPTVIGWLKDDDGERVMGMAVEYAHSAHNPDSADEVMECTFYLVHDKEDIYAKGEFFIDKVDCITDM